MIKFFHPPTRDARDADHLAILLFIGGVLAFFKLSGIVESAKLIWTAMAIISVITAPLLWVRVPHVKWGGAIASVLLGLSSVVDSIDKATFGLSDVFLPAATLVIAYWFFVIDYSHRFEYEDS